MANRLLAGKGQGWQQASTRIPASPSPGAGAEIGADPDEKLSPRPSAQENIMSRRQSHLSSLLETLCETLAECARIEKRARAGSHAHRKALEIREATEPLALGCLDEELAGVPRMRMMVYSSASLPLVDHLHGIDQAPVPLGDAEWSLLMQSASPQTVEALLDRSLVVRGAILPMLREIRSGKTEWREVFFRRIARIALLSEEEIGQVILMRHRGMTEDAVRLLEIQGQSHPDDFVRYAQNALRARDDLFTAATCILAGAPVERIKEESMASNSVSALFLQHLSSNHGRLAFHKAVPSLSDLFSDNGSWSAYSRGLYAELRKIPQAAL